MKKIKQLIQFFQDLWANKPSDKSDQNFLFKALHILISTIKGFMEDKGFDKASALTYYSLLSIIPLIAIGFGIAQQLGFADKFSEQVQSHFQNQPQVAEKLISFSNSTLKTTKGGIIAGFGLMILIYTVFSMIGKIASSFDEIWKIKSSPTLWQQVKRYIPLIFLFPIFLVVSSSAVIYISTKAVLATQSIDILHVLGPVVQILFQLIPYLVSWALLSFFYIYLPNTKVSWKAGIIAAIITGIAYVIWQWIYVTFQLHAASYGTIYGSFAAVPLFLIWLNYSWLIILFGSELAYHIQHGGKGK